MPRGFNVDTDTWDGTHPNNQGSQKMAQVWYQAMLDATVFSSAASTDISTKQYGFVGNSHKFTADTGNISAYFERTNYFQSYLLFDCTAIEFE